MTASTPTRSLIGAFAAIAFLALCASPAAAQRAGANGGSTSSTGGAATGSTGIGGNSTGGAATGSTGAAASSTGGAATGSNGVGASSTGGAAASTGGTTSSAASTGAGVNSTARAPTTAPGDHGKIWLGEDASSSCGAGPNLPDPDLWSDAGDGVKAISRATKSYIMGCHCDTQACIADALDKYAAALAVVAPRLPRELQNLPSLVSNAARRVRAARTKAAAVAILKETIAHVHKEIELVRADDPDTLRRQTRGGTFAEGTLETAAIKLERADNI